MLCPDTNSLVSPHALLFVVHFYLEKKFVFLNFELVMFFNLVIIPQVYILCLEYLEIHWKK